MESEKGRPTHIAELIGDRAVIRRLGPFPFVALPETQTGVALTRL
jgi:hypothetical protein